MVGEKVDSEGSKMVPEKVVAKVGEVEVAEEEEEQDSSVDSRKTDEMDSRVDRREVDGEVEVEVEQKEVE